MPPNVIVRPVQPTDHKFHQPARRQIASEIFFMKMPVGFNSTPAQQLTAFSKAEGFDAIIKAGWSDLNLARVQFKESEFREEWSTTQVPIRGILGGSGEVAPLRPLLKQIPNYGIYLPAMSQIMGNFINTGAEPAGTCVFYCEKVSDPKRDIRGDVELSITKSRPYRLFADLGVTSLTSLTDNVDYDLLIWGAVTNCDGTIIGTVINNSSLYAWSSENVPFRAFAGVDGQPQPDNMFPHPYWLPANTQLRCNFNTAVAGNYIEFIAEKIYG